MFFVCTFVSNVGTRMHKTEKKSPFSTMFKRKKSFEVGDSVAISQPGANANFFPQQHVPKKKKSWHKILHQTSILLLTSSLFFSSWQWSMPVWQHCQRLLPHSLAFAFFPACLSRIQDFPYSTSKGGGGIPGKKEKGEERQVFFPFSSCFGQVQTGFATCPSRPFWRRCEGKKKTFFPPTFSLSLSRKCCGLFFHFIFGDKKKNGGWVAKALLFITFFFLAKQLSYKKKGGFTHSLLTLVLG